jgi:Domain of unknown function (DUF4279)
MASGHPGLNPAESRRFWQLVREAGVWGSGGKGDEVQVESRVYFAVASDALNPGQLADKIGLAPSAVSEKAPRRGVPQTPATNSWRLDSGLDRTASVEDHLEALLVLIAPVAASIGELCKGEPVARLEIVREFRPRDGEADLGFALDERWLEVISQTGAFVDIDEYDLTAKASSADETARQYMRYEDEAATLAAVGAALFPQPTSLTMRLPRELADRAVTAWHRDDDSGPAKHETPRERTARHRAGTLALIGLAIEQTGKSDGGDVICELDAWHIGDALGAADDSELL